MVIKQYGLKRSGTNFLKALMMENFDCVVLGFVGGNKHEMIDFDFPICLGGLVSNVSEDILREYHIELKKDPKLICIYKNPHSWVYSYCIAYKKQITDERIRELMDTYNEMNRHWAEHCLMIDYHRLIDHPTEQLGRISKEFGLDFKTSPIMKITKTTRRASEEFNDKLFRSNDFFKGFYDNKEYLNGFNPNQIKLINLLNGFYEGLSV